MQITYNQRNKILSTLNVMTDFNYSSIGDDFIEANLLGAMKAVYHLPIKEDPKGEKQPRFGTSLNPETSYDMDTGDAAYTIRVQERRLFNLLARDEHRFKKNMALANAQDLPWLSDYLRRPEEKIEVYIDKAAEYIEKYSHKVKALFSPK